MSGPRIRVLPAAVVSKIAAGEMIERPASVVKELLENALDAGASRISLNVDGSLDRSLSVIDDGCGMTRDEAKLALERHATSKIQELEDLYRLRTLGFRGEALPSIAAVSAMVITTRTAGQESATQLEIVGGELLGIREVSRQPGTTVRVRDLYFNVPVRRKFMKTERGELRVSSRLLANLALAYPCVRFTVERTGAAPVVYESASDLRERAAQIYGRTRTQEMLAVSSETNGVAVTGLISPPRVSHATREQQVLILNGRPILSPLLNHALRMGYGDLIPPDRHPMSVLALSVDPGLVDVNVHPTKREVKFAHEAVVFEAVRDAVRAALGSLSPAPSAIGFVRDRPTGSERPSGAHPGWGAQPGARSGTAAGQTFLDLWGPPERGETPAGEPSPAPPPAERKFWQLHRRYVFAQTHSGVLVIDQHAAHERILYEKALARLDGAAATSQRLLFPETLELPLAEFELFTEIQAPLERLGFEVESFGGGSVIVHAIPDGLGAVDAGQLLRDLMEEYLEFGRSIRETRERLARAFACQGAVKSGTPLSTDEMSALIDALFATTTPHGDPHGRPTLIQLSLLDLDRRFGRA